jgi:hypothetical protein
VPSVIVTPLDAHGRPVGTGARAQVDVPRFRTLLPEPSASAHGFRLEIASPPPPRPLPPTTTAEAPAPTELAEPALPALAPPPAAPVH